MIFQHAEAAPHVGPIFFKFLACGLYPDVITRAKFQVDQSKGLEATAYGCLNRVF